MDFLDKLDFMMNKLGINKSKLSAISGVPYTTIDTFYKKGYENTKLSTVKKLSEALDVSMDYLLVDTITDEDYGKTNGFHIDYDEMNHIKKYRLLDDHGKEAVDSILEIEHRRCIAQNQPAIVEQITDVYFVMPGFLSTMSAGTGIETVDEYPENYKLTKEPPRGASYIATVSGDSMEPTFYTGDKLFIRVCTEIPVGKVGVFYMDGKMWVKELGDGVLISHNPAYDPIPMREDIRCQGLVLGVCDDSYFE